MQPSHLLDLSLHSVGNSEAKTGMSAVIAAR